MNCIFFCVWNCDHSYLQMVWNGRVGRELVPLRQVFIHLPITKS